MQKVKRLLAYVLTFAMVITLLPGNAVKVQASEVSSDTEVTSETPDSEAVTSEEASSETTMAEETGSEVKDSAVSEEVSSESIGSEETATEAVASEAATEETSEKAEEVKAKDAAPADVTADKEETVVDNKDAATTDASILTFEAPTETDEFKVGEDGVSATREIEYDAAEYSRNINFPGYTIDKNLLKQRLGLDKNVEDDDISIYNEAGSLACYLDGEKVSNSKADTQRIYVSRDNAAKTVRYEWTVTATKIAVEDADGDETYYKAPADMKLTYTITFEYTGVTKEKIDAKKADLSDYYTIGKNVSEDAEVVIGNTDYYTSSKSVDVMSNTINEDGKDDDKIVVGDVFKKPYNNDSTYNTRYTIHYVDGTEDEEKQVAEFGNFYNHAWNGYDSDNNAIYKDNYYTLTLSGNKAFGTRNKQVDYYEWNIDLCYGRQVLTTITKKVYVKINPFDTIDEDAIVPVEARQNGTVTVGTPNLTVSSYWASTYKRLEYQWYERMSEDGSKDELIAGETAFTLTTKLKDGVKAYVCKVAVKTNAAQFPDGYLSKLVTDEVVYPVAGYASGYRLTAQADVDEDWIKTIPVGLQDEAVMSVDAVVDDGFNLKYQWKHVVNELDENGDKVYKEDSSYKYAAKENVLPEKTNTYTKKVTSQSDYDYYQPGIYNYTTLQLFHKKIIVQDFLMYNGFA